MKANWNYPTTVWVGNGRISDINLACKNLKIKKPLFVTDKDLISLEFVKKVIKKRDAMPFRIPENINLVMVDVDTGLPPNSNSKKIIYEAFKPQDEFLTELEKYTDKARLGLYDSKDKKNVLRFY